LRRAQPARWGGRRQNKLSATRVARDASMGQDRRGGRERDRGGWAANQSRAERAMLYSQHIEPHSTRAGSRLMAGA
jgi:hypothetical protein